MRISPIISGIFLFLIGCGLSQKQMDLKENSFHIFVDENAENELFESRGIRADLRYSAQLYYGNTYYKLDDIKTRGQNSLEYRRKSFAVNVKGKLKYYDKLKNDTIKFEKFVLSAMPMDCTYVKNKIAHSLLKKVDLWPLYSSYTEVFINNHHQGLYLFIESPKEYAFKKLKAKSIIKRGYNHYIADITTKYDDEFINVFNRRYNHYIASKLNFKKMKISSELYIQKFNHIYEILPVLNGKELCDSLELILNLNNYMKKIAMDVILQNGDYTDEIYFYSKSGKNANITFDVIPWDYDDIFSSMPHEIARTDSLGGTCFGFRVYPTLEDFEKETKGRLVYSIEDDLDYMIMKDDYLYKKYLYNLEDVLNKIDSNYVITNFENLEKELLVYYQIPEVINQSKFDENETNINILLANINDKRRRLLGRIEWLKTEVLIQKNQL